MNYSNRDSILEMLSYEDYAEASISNNPNFAWAKFILTDSLPNKNNHRIPEEEFDNVIKTALFTPIKMARGQISDGHEFAEPIGAITHLKRVDNKILGLAVLWKRERPADIAYLEELHKSNVPINLSWELTYEDSEIDANGVASLRNVAVNGVAIVGMPAYGGRTPIIALASENTVTEERDMNEEILEQETPQEEEKTTDQVAQEKDNSEYNDLLEQIKTLNASIDELKEKYSQLLEEKNRIEALLSQELRLKEIKSLFAEFGVQKPEQYFEQNREMLLGMDKTALEFMLQEMVSGLEKSANSSVTQVPPVMLGSPKVTREDIINFLKSYRRK